MTDFSSFSPLDVLGSPIYNVADTVSNLPFVNQTGLQSWLQTSPVTQGVRNFQNQHPGWATVADLAGYAIPFAGWDAALAKAGLEGAGLLSGVNRAARGAAQLFPQSRLAGLAAGETVHYAPLGAALTAFDTAGGHYQSPFDVAGALAGNTLGFGLGGAALHGIGRAIAPAVGRIPLVGPTFQAIFENSPRLSSLYGFSDSVQEIARKAAAVPQVQEALNPGLSSQQQGALIWQIRENMQTAQANQLAGLPVDDPRLLEIDPGLMDSQYDEAARRIFTDSIDPTQTALNFTPRTMPKRALTALDKLFRFTPESTETYQLVGKGRDINNPDTLAAKLELPDGWIHRMILPALQTNADRVAKATQNFAELIRDTPSGAKQNWRMQYEPNSSSYYMAVQHPTESGKWLTFKTTDPSHFLSDLKLDLDNPDPTAFNAAYQFTDRVPKGASPILDRLMDLRRLYLSPENIRGFYGAMAKGKGYAEQFAREVLGGPAFGTEIMNFIRHYAAPTDQQLLHSAEARGSLGIYQSAFDALEERKNSVLYGTASIPEDKSPIASLLTFTPIEDSDALVTQLREAHKNDPDLIEQFRQVVKENQAGEIDMASLVGTPVGKLLGLFDSTMNKELAEYNKAINTLRNLGATKAPAISLRKNHYGFSNRWDGDFRIPIYLPSAVEPDTVVAGHTLAQAQQKATQWLADREAWLGKNGKPREQRRLGKPYVIGQDEEIPGFMRLHSNEPGILEPRQGLMGFEHQYTPYKHMDDLIKELEDNYAIRTRYVASTLADALTAGQMSKIKYTDPYAYKILTERVGQLKGQAGPWEQTQNRMVDNFGKQWWGTNGASKGAAALNELNFHFINGSLNIATPALNMFNYLQTAAPAALEFLTTNPELLRANFYHFPRIGPDGKPQPGTVSIPDVLGLFWGGINKAMNPGKDAPVFEHLFNKKVMGAGLANEYTGQDRSIALRASEGIKDPADFAHWAKRLSSILMVKTEQVSRTLAAGIGLHSQDLWEKMYGVPFTMDQRINNAANMARRANYGFYKYDRPMMYTTPLGSIFGNQKTWMTNYLFMMMHYFGLGTKQGNWGPFALAMGTTGALGGALAVPLLAQGADILSNMFNHKSAQETIYDAMGEGGNAISFGLPGLLGLSFSGNLSAPGSNLAHDSNFFFTITALERMKALGQMFGRGWDDQMILGMNPMKDELFQRQMANALAPRSLYRAYEAVTSDAIESRTTGFPMIRHLSPADRTLRAMGFSTADIDLQYAAYERLLRNKTQMTHVVSVLSDAYARASINHDAGTMGDVLRQTAVMGIDLSRVMSAARGRMHDFGFDMFGRNFRQDQLNQESSVLSSAGRY